DYLNNFCSTYLDDILIYNNNPFKHTKYRLRDVELYINLKKYKFLVIKVKYLKLIITIKGVHIDPKKVRIITK
ncbi:uncharacterized protein K441DRAFT_570493, partial [Cenococcum geophilum 1.58]|uniref:uncharacterized protein n=1 Tax=Cenococcum geophilum 1.58 TaxID=794803 RepID=UPI00358DEEB6